jgi:hypothetical protein
MVDEEYRPAWPPSIKEAKEILVGELAVPGEWVVAHIECNKTWPKIK